MCDYCGCRRSGPTAELAGEHERLLELGDILHTALHDGTDASGVFAELVRLLQIHAAKEEIGLFVHAKASTPLGERIDALCREHDDLHRWLADGLAGPHVPDALRLLVSHIDDEEYDLFPHIIHALDPEQWDEIELAHRAVDVVWNQPGSPTTPRPTRPRPARRSG
jgi:hemerythrin-like domain-containing protein